MALGMRHDTEKRDRAYYTTGSHRMRPLSFTGGVERTAGGYWARVCIKAASTGNRPRHLGKRCGDAPAKSPSAAIQAALRKLARKLA